MVEGMTLNRKIEVQFWVVVFLSALLSLFVIAPITYMLADNQPPYEYDAENSYVIPSKTMAGRQMSVHWKLKKLNRICSGSVTRVIVDEQTGVRTYYDPTPVTRTLDIGDMTIDRTFYLPPLISPGPKWYYADIEYACNILQHFYPLRVRTPRLPFNVDEP